ncbi:MAG TPA: hypothetical protein PKK13_04125 [Spirochaetota bacterium]|jgi:hypothetical protein|nr:MAG: hypothetical protein BWX91_00077 [Spirochaetes bacterium ADurb.Bin133]HNZ26393.1 hypothetical protein [Spirochaetota bacterium]
MKIKLFLPAILIFVLCCCSCSNEVDPDYLPSFDGIEANKDNIFFLDRESKCNKIYVINTKENKKINTYEFNNIYIDYLVYDASFDLNPYLLINNKLLKFDVEFGRLIEIGLDYTPDYLEIVEDKLWVIPMSVGYKNVPKRYLTYDASIDKTEYIIIPEGLFIGSYFIFNGNTYLPIVFQSDAPKIYNLTTNKIISNLFTNDKSYYDYYLIKSYLFSAYYNNDNKLVYDVYFVNSFEPTFNYNYLFTTDEEYLFGAIYENENYLYYMDRDYIMLMDKKDNYTVKSFKELNGDSRNFVTYCRNGYIWLVSDNNDGAYKVDMDDLSYEIIN